MILVCIFTAGNNKSYKMECKSKISTLLISIFIAVVLASSCSKSSTNNSTPAAKRTSLQMTIRDASGTYSVPTPYPLVQLFKTNTDRQNKTNPVTNLRTGNSKGVVLFDSLEAINYLFNAYTSDLTKSNATTGNQTTTLIGGQLNVISATVR